MTKAFKWLVLGLLCVVLAACDYPGGKTPQPTPQPGPGQTWIDAPLNDSTLPLLPYKLVFHAASHFGLDVFEVWINGVLLGNTAPLSFTGEGGPSGTLYYGDYLWHPSAPGDYIIGVRALKGSGQGAMVEENVTINPMVAELTTPLPLAPTSTPTITPTPTFTPNPTFTPTLMDLSCNLTALVNLFCRPGPGFEPSDSFTPGQSTEVIGFSSDGFYVFVTGINSGRQCTVPNDPSLVELSGGGCDGLPRLSLPTPPTATFTPTPTATTTSPPSRQAQCDDGVDNDGDSLIDLNDRECRDANDNDESTP